jgi:hypothetical protein
METAVRLGLNLVVVILDDGGYGMIRWKQASDNFPDYGMTFDNPDFVTYANAYGAMGHRVGRTEDLVPTLEAAFSAGGVHIVAVPIDFPKTPVSWSRNCAAASPISSPPEGWRTRPCCKSYRPMIALRSPKFRRMTEPPSKPSWRLPIGCSGIAVAG